MAGELLAINYLDMRELYGLFSASLAAAAAAAKAAALLRLNRVVYNVNHHAHSDTQSVVGYLVWIHERGRDCSLELHPVVTLEQRRSSRRRSSGGAARG